ncbi:uncharacterized protein FSUBG_6861 [Fusarium subglutinans]|uniref:Uncharacterized protein n=1 Tax=Gibberella subglutinans TaxID=42677 RepID=A0A8H5PXV1_GIBSU|nr:uncharacterized protein FSUBG_6861 [Fusarium subglutinans]KAF5604558.1 hypothetical protein FSUBG_6861 [Fusarium subglutinans]
MDTNQSSSAPRPPVIIHCPGGETLYAMSKAECGQAAFEDAFRHTNLEREYGITRAERASGGPNTSPGTGINALKSLAGQLLHVLNDMEKLQKQKEEIMKQIESRGGIIEEPKK